MPVKLGIFAKILLDYLRWLLLSPLRALARARSRGASLPIHEASVRVLACEIAAAASPIRTERKRIGHMTRPRSTFAAGRLDISRLDRIVSIDPLERRAVIEPLVTMEALVRATAKFGLRPPVVPEFSQITVGGAIQGLAGESTSHRFGLFHESVEWMELLLADGRIVRASPGGDLWRAVPGSYGTIAVVTLAELRLAPMPHFVELSYHRLGTAELAAAVRASSEWEFLDAISFGGEECLLVRGRGVDTPTAPLYRAGSAAPWFDRHLAGRTDGERECMRAIDYLFRYDRGAFFVGSSKLGDSWLMRALFGGYATAENLYRLRGFASISGTRVVQDVGVPIDELAPFVRSLRREILPAEGPLWFCPIHGRHPLLFGPREAGLYVNIGIYNRSGRSREAFERLNRAIEREVKRRRGFKALYASIHYDEREFWALYDRDEYRRVREEYGAEGRLEDIYEKLTCRAPERGSRSR